MAGFPSDSTTNVPSLMVKWTTIRARTGRIKNDTITYNASSSVSLPSVLDFQARIVNYLSELDTLTANATTNGLLGFAQAQENNPTLDLVGLYGTMRTQIAATITWISTNFPKDASGNAVLYTFAVDGSPQPVYLTTAQLTAFKTQITSLGATIA
jgi:hypothetical protein